jgi:hypothetical protein
VDVTDWNRPGQEPDAGDPPLQPLDPTGARHPSGAPAGKHRRFEVATNWVTAFTAVAAFVLSMLTYLQVNRTPDVHVVMPNVLRVNQNENGYVGVFLQPTFTASRKTERPAIVSNVNLLVEPQVSDKKMPSFWWVENVQMQQLEDGTYIRSMVSDPAPLLIFGSEPVSPMMWFSSEVPSPALEVGKMRMTLFVEWQDRPTISNDFCIDLTQEAFEEFNRPEEVGLMQKFTKHESSECYLIVP